MTTEDTNNLNELVNHFDQLTPESLNNIAKLQEIEKLYGSVMQAVVNGNIKQSEFFEALRK